MAKNQVPHNCLIGNKKSDSALVVLGGNIKGYEDYSKYFCVIGCCMTQTGAKKILKFIKDNKIDNIFIAGKDTPFKIRQLLLDNGGKVYRYASLNSVQYTRDNSQNIIYTEIAPSKPKPENSKLDKISFHIIPAKNLFEVTVLNKELVYDSFICSKEEVLYKIANYKMGEYIVSYENFKWCYNQIISDYPVFSSLKEALDYYKKKILSEGKQYKDERGNIIKELSVFFKITNYKPSKEKIDSATENYIKQVNGEVLAKKFSYDEFALIKYQIAPLLKILKFPKTRRAFLLFAREKDVEAQLQGVERSCPHIIYFRIENKKLNYTVIMRSNDLLKGFIPDFLAFHNLIKKRIASRLKIPIGNIYWFANSMHIYEDIK